MSGVDLYWLPLGAGGHSVRLNGRVYEAVLARREKRAFVIEMAPVRDANGTERGVVAEGPAGRCGSRQGAAPLAGVPV